MFFAGAKFIAYLFITYPISTLRDIVLSSVRKQTSEFWPRSISPLDKTRHLFLGEFTTKLDGSRNRLLQNCETLAAWFLELCAMIFQCIAYRI